MPENTVTPQDLDIVTRTIIGESAGEPREGQVAVAHVIRSRVKAGGYGGSTPTAVALAPAQFEPWTTRRRELEAIDPNSDKYKAAYAIAKAVFDGTEPDPTNGALNFANVDTVKARGDAAGRPGGWLSTMTNVTKIGRHTFGTSSSASARPRTEGIQPALGQSPIRYSDQTVPYVTPTVSQAVQETERMAHREANSPSLWQGMKDAVSSEWITSSLLGDTPAKAAATPDPNWRWEPEAFKEATKDVPKEYWASLSEAHSAGHAQWLQDRIREKIDVQKRLDEMGWTGTGLRTAAALLDPAALGLAIATEGVAASVLIPAKASALARISGRALSAGLAGGAVVAAKDATDLEERHASEYLWGIGLGLGLGGTIGALTGRKAPDLASSLIGSGERLQRDASGILGQVPDAGSAGARRLAPKDFFLNDEALEAIQDGDIPRSALNGKWRQDSAAVIDRSNSPAARALGSALLQDEVGRVGHVLNGTAAETEMRRLYNVDAAKLARAEKGIYEEWASKQGLNFIEREKQWPAFIDEVGRYVRSPESFAEVDPAVSKLADHYRKFFADRLDHQKNPLRERNMDARPVGGAENVKFNANYLPRVDDLRKVRELHETFGSDTVRDLVAGAIRSAQPDLDEKVIQKMAAGRVKRRFNEAHGATDDPKFAFLGRDEDVLRQVLADEYGLAGADIDHVISKLPQKTPSTEGGVESFMKRRIDLDEGYELRNVTDRYGKVHESLKFSDMLVNDVSQLANVYNRRTAGRIALSRVRIKNAEGELVVNGITKDSEFQKLIDAIRKQGADNAASGGKVGDIEAAITNLEWAYAQILGRPAPGLTGWTGSEKFRTFSRWSRKYNFTRLMGNMGWNQAHEGINIVTQAGFKATMQQVPSLKRIRDMDGALVRQHGLSEELETIFGLGSEDLRNSRFPRWDEYGGDYRSSRSTMVNRVDTVLDKAGEATSYISVFKYLNEVTQVWSARALAQKFANLADNPTAANLKRMSAVGLDEPTLKSALGQIKKHATREDGALFSDKLKRLNMDNWDDLDARAAFENALFRWSRKVIQENDYGSMAHWMSDPLVQMITQFRSFVINGFAKQFLHNVHMRDFDTFTMVAASMVAGTAIYAAQEQLKAIGRQDREAHLKKRLSPEKLAWAGFAKSGWASILPDAMATVARPLAIPLPNVRSSGQASDVWFGNPSTGLFDDVSKAAAGLSQAATGRRGLTKDDLSNTARAFPWGNTIPMVTLMNFLGHGLRDRPATR